MNYLDEVKKKLGGAQFWTNTDIPARALERRDVENLIEAVEGVVGLALVLEDALMDALDHAPEVNRAVILSKPNKVHADLPDWVKEML